MYLSRSGAILACGCASRGGRERTLFDPQWIMSQALRLGAQAVIVAHNHPSGDTEPSPEDHAATRRLCEVARVVGIDVLDHLVVAGTSWTSMAARSEMPVAKPALAQGWLP